MDIVIVCWIVCSSIIMITTIYLQSSSVIVWNRYFSCSPLVSFSYFLLNLLPCRPPPVVAILFQPKVYRLGYHHSNIIYGISTSASLPWPCYFGMYSKSSVVVIGDPNAKININSYVISLLHFLQVSCVINQGTGSKCTRA